MTEKIFQKSNWKYKTGLALTVFWSIFIGLFHIGVLFLLGIPIVFLWVGIYLIWISNVNSEKKAWLTLLPIPIVVGIISLQISLNKAEPEIYLIPQNFRGEFVIKFNEPCGESIIYEKGRRIYLIPQNGVLILKGKQTSGFTDRKYFSFDDDGNLTELPKFSWSKFEDEKNQFSWIFTRHKLTKELLGVLKRPAIIDYQRVTVSNYQLLEDEENPELESKLFQKRIEYLLKECRQQEN